MESRGISRWDAAAYAREAYDLGVRYIGGCCGFQAYHIRAMAEELSQERGGRLPLASDKSDINLEVMKKLSSEKGQSRYDVRQAMMLPVLF